MKKVFDLLPSFTEAYRVASFIETQAGDLYKASDELETALEYDGKSAVIHYQYAQLLLQKLDDAPLALIQVDSALKLDPDDETLETLRALCLSRLGRCEEAADIYERQLAKLPGRPRKWRITTRDQASECYRRWAEQDLKMKDNKCFEEHIDRASSILEEAIGCDDRMGGLLASVVEDSLFYSTAAGNEQFARKQLDRFIDAGQAVRLPKFKRFVRDNITQFFGEQSEIGRFVAKLPADSIFPEVRSHLQQSLNASSQSFSGFIKALPPKVDYGFITNGMSDWFFHRTALVTVSDWASLRERDRVTFDQEIDNSGRLRAIRISKL